MPICNHNKFKQVLSGKDNLSYIKGKFNLVKCTHCSLMLTNPRPDSNEIKKFYPDTYKPYNVNFNKATLLAKIRQKFSPIFKIIDPKDTIDFDLKKDTANVLEIGCGAGNFLYELKLLHPKWNIVGTDISKKNIDILNKNKINAFVSDLTKLPIKTKSIDIVYGWMIIEHIHKLNQALSEVNRVLKDNSIFCLSIPNAGSWEFKFFGKNWFALQLPTHLYHFTNTTISKLLQKNGFKTKKIIYQKTFSNFFLSTEIYIKNSHLPKTLKYHLNLLFSWHPIYHILTLPISIILSILKQSGRMTVISQKI